MKTLAPRNKATQLTAGEGQGMDSNFPSVQVWDDQLFKEPTPDTAIQEQQQQQLI